MADQLLAIRNGEPVGKHWAERFVKGAELMLHQNALLAARNRELEEQLAEMTKRKSRKRKRIQHGGTMEYGTAAAKVAAKVSAEPQRSKMGRGGSDQETAQPAVRRCGNCGGTGQTGKAPRRPQTSPPTPAPGDIILHQALICTPGPLTPFAPHSTEHITLHRASRRCQRSRQIEVTRTVCRIDRAARMKQQRRLYRTTWRV